MARKKERNSFLLYKDWEALFRKDNAWDLIHAVFDYQKNGTLPDPENERTGTFYVMLPQMERDIEAYKEKCEKNKENIDKYWEEEKKRRSEQEKPKKTK